MQTHPKRTKRQHQSGAVFQTGRTRRSTQTLHRVYQPDGISGCDSARLKLDHHHVTYKNVTITSYYIIYLTYHYLFAGSGFNSFAIISSQTHKYTFSSAN